MSGNITKGKLALGTDYLEDCVNYLKSIKPPTNDGYGTTNWTNAWYGAYSQGGDYMHVNYACHERFRQVDFVPDISYNKFNYNHDKKYSESTRAYFDWITDKDDSPWKEALPQGTKLVNGEDIGSKEFMWNYGFIFWNVDVVPSNVHHQINVAARMAKEWPELVLTWYTLVSVYGFTREWAYAFITLWYGENQYRNFLNQSSFRLAFQNWYDYPLDMSTCDEDYVKNFLKGTMVGKRNQPYKYCTEYTPVNALWGNNSAPSNTGNSYVNILQKMYRSKYGNGEAKTDSFGKIRNQVWEIKGAKDLIRLGLEEQDRLYASIHKDRKKVI